jgi:hypothetical protein
MSRPRHAWTPAAHGQPPPAAPTLPPTAELAPRGYRAPVSWNRPGPGWVSLRAAVVARLHTACGQLCIAAYDRRNSDPIAPHAVLFLYSEVAGTDDKGQPTKYDLRVGTRIALEGPETLPLPGMLAGLTGIAQRRALANPNADPFRSMVDREDQRGRGARFLGVAVATLDVLPRHPWARSRERVTQILHVPQRGYALLIDGTAVQLDRGAPGTERKTLSNATLDPDPTVPMYPYTFTANVPYWDNSPDAPVWWAMWNLLQQGRRDEESMAGSDDGGVRH